MNDLFIDAMTNDFVIKSEEFAVTTSFAQSVAQAIRVQLKLIRGEWFVDEDIGLPILDILGRPLNAVTLLSLFRDQIAQVHGVKSIKEINIKPDMSTRIVDISFSVELINSETLSQKHIVRP